MLLSEKIELSKRQRKALKLLSVHGASAKPSIHHRTFQSLVNLGLVNQAGIVTPDGLSLVDSLPGRPPKDGRGAPNRPQFPITLPPSKLARIDIERGKQSRAEFIEAILDLHWAKP